MTDGNFKYLNAVENVFPVTWVNKFSHDKKIKIIGIYIFSIFLSFLGEYLNPSKPHLFPLDGFIEVSSPTTIFLKEIWGIVYSPFGILIVLNFLYFFYLLTLFLFVPSFKRPNYIQFILPFLSLSIIGVLHGLFKVTISTNFFPAYIYLALFIYILIFYCFLLFRIYNINIFKCFLIVFLPFLILELFFGMACIAPYLI